MNFIELEKRARKSHLKAVKKVAQRIFQLQKYSRKWWYPSFGAFMAALDQYVVIIPVDGLLASSVLLNPKKWFVLALFFTFGSSFGVLGYVWILHTLGIDNLMSFFPSLFQTQTWEMAEKFFASHGAWVVFFSGISPLPQQPAVIVTALAEVPFWTIAGMLLTGRFLKFVLIAYLSSFAPEKLFKLWGIQQELKEMHIQAENLPKTEPTKNWG